jgi:hypothetical protein
MIACITPSDAFLEESLSTLTYATKASCIAVRECPAPLRANCRHSRQVAFEFLALMHQVNNRHRAQRYRNKKRYSWPSAEYTGGCPKRGRKPSRN